MGKRIIYLFIVVCISTTIFAQEQDATTEINNIKAHVDEYIYAEVTSVTWEDAIDNAKYLLNIEIDEWLDRNNISEKTSYLEKAHEFLKEIKAMRGDKYRAFVYIQINDIMSLQDSGQRIIKIENGDNFVDEKITTNEEKNQQTNIASLNSKNSLLSDIEQAMLSVIDANNIEAFIKKFRNEDKITSYGRMKDIPTNGECYIFVYNRDMGISAYLKKTTNGYINIKTGALDNLSNYKGCGAIWFRNK